MAALTKWTDQSITLTVSNKAQDISGIAYVITSLSSMSFGTAKQGASNAAISLKLSSLSNTGNKIQTNSTQSFYCGTKTQASVAGQIAYELKYANGGVYSGSTDTLTLKNAVESVSTTSVGAKWASDTSNAPSISWTPQCGGTAFADPTTQEFTLSGASNAGVSLSDGKLVIATTATLAGSAEITGVLNWTADKIAGGARSTEAGSKLITFKNDVTNVTVTPVTFWSDSMGVPTLTPVLYCQGDGSSAYITPTLQNLKTNPSVATGLVWNGTTFSASSNARINKTKSFSATMTWDTVAPGDVTVSSVTVATIKEAVSKLYFNSGNQEIYASVAGNSFDPQVVTATGGTANVTPTLANATTKPSAVSTYTTKNQLTLAGNKFTFSYINGSVTLSGNWTWTAIAASTKTLMQSSTSTSGVSQFVFKNAVDTITLNSDVNKLYTTVDNPIEISYVVKPLIAGNPYSYVMGSEGTATQYITTKTNVASGTNGVVKFTPTSSLAGQNVTLTITSDNAREKVSSNTITIYVTSAAQEVFLDWGDSTTITVPTGSQITKFGTNASSAPTTLPTTVNAVSKTGTYCTASISGETLTITAKTSGAGYDSFQLTSGQIIKVNVSGITITLS